MKALPLLLSAAALALAGTAHADSRAVTDYLDRANARATAELAAAGVATDRPVTVKVRVGSDGRLTAARVIGSSGSAETDQKTLKALRRFRVAGPPNALVGVDITVAVGPPALVQAKVP